MYLVPFKLLSLLHFFTKKQNHLHVFLLLDDVSDEKRVCPFCSVISFHWISQRIRLNRNSLQYKSIRAEQVRVDTRQPRHNHSFQIPGNDKRRGMNRKILPHCLLINLTETSNSTYILVVVDII